MNSGVAVDNSTELSNFCGKSCILKLLLHLSWAKLSKITTILSWSAFAMFKSDLGKIAACFEVLDDLVNAINRFLLWSSNGGTFVSNHWVSRAGMLQKNMGASDRRLEVNHFYLEFESGVWWDDSSSTTFSVGILRWARQNCFLSSWELHHAFIPASDDLSDTNLKFEWSSLFDGGVENSSVHESTMVMSSDECAWYRFWSRSFIEKFDLHFSIFYLVKKVYLWIIL